MYYDAWQMIMAFTWLNPGTVMLKKAEMVYEKKYFRRGFVLLKKAGRNR